MSKRKEKEERLFLGKNNFSKRKKKGAPHALLITLEFAKREAKKKTKKKKNSLPWHKTQTRLLQTRDDDDDDAH